MLLIIELWLENLVQRKLISPIKSHCKQLRPCFGPIHLPNRNCQLWKQKQYLELFHLIQIENISYNDIIFKEMIEKIFRLQHFWMICWSPVRKPEYTRDLGKLSRPTRWAKHFAKWRTHKSGIWNPFPTSSYLPVFHSSSWTDDLIVSMK